MALKKLGVNTTLIIGPSNIDYQNDLITKKIISAEQMFNEVKKSLPVDVAVCAAAVSDFKPVKKSKNKLKKEQKKLKVLEMKQNVDILDFLGKTNKHRPKLVIGFSAETENVDKNSILKMRKKNCDLIIANNVSNKKFGFNSDYNSVSIIDSNGSVKKINKSKKSFIANKIAELILKKLLINDKQIN